jgi:hypothetical protein
VGVLDSILDWAVVVLPTVAGFVWPAIEKRMTGVSTKKQRIVFGALGILFSGLIFLQQHRSRVNHDAEVLALTGRLDQQLKELAQLRSEADEDRARADEDRARRQQAEKDLALIIQATGQSTRIGVAEDIRKAPLQLEPPPKNDAELEFSLAEFLSGASPVLQSPITVQGNKATFRFFVVNHSGVAALNGYLWLYLCQICEFATLPSGFSLISSGRPFEARAGFPRLFSGSQLAYEATVQIPAGTRSFEVALKYACETCKADAPPQVATFKVSQ